MTRTRTAMLRRCEELDDIIADSKESFEDLIKSHAPMRDINAQRNLFECAEYERALLVAELSK